MKKIVFLLLIFIGSVSMASANFFDGLSQDAISWIKGKADEAHADGFNDITGQANYDGVAIQVSFNEHYPSYWISVSDRGTFEYYSYSSITSQLSTAVTKESLEANAQQSNNTTEESSYHSSSENKEPLISSDTPAASADKAGLRIAEHVMTPRSKTKAQKKAAETLSSEGALPLIGGSISYEDFDVYGINGETFEVVASIEIDADNFSYGLLLPLSYVDFANGDWSKLGLTSYLRKSFEFDSFSLSAGFNVSVEQTWMDLEGIDDSLAYGAGPLFSFITDLDFVEIKVGLSYQYTDNSEYDSVEIITSALNFGIPVGDNMIFNLYGYNVSNQDSENDYWKLGGEVTYMVSGIFGFTAGFNTVEDHDFYDSETIYLGSSWKYS